MIKSVHSDGGAHHAVGPVGIWHTVRRCRRRRTLEPPQACGRLKIAWLIGISAARKIKIKKDVIKCRSALSLLWPCSADEPIGVMLTGEYKKRHT